MPHKFRPSGSPPLIGNAFTESAMEKADAGDEITNKR